MMNQAIPDQERAPASESVWERPWSLEEIRRSSQSWSLAADAGLLQFLQEFSQQTISRTHEIKKQVDGLIRETKATDCRLHNVFNDFLMLSNTQFIENRVYDEEVEEPVLKAVTEKTEQEKTREQKEVDLIPKVQEAVNYGLQVLDSAFEQLDIKAGNSDSEEDDANERVELILEPKDLYIDRPLPYLIGSKLFMEQEDVGLGELSSEEGSVGSDRGSIVDSEEENEEESDGDFANHTDNDQNRHTAQASDEEEDDDGCDIFADSEKEEEDTEDIGENTRPKRSRPTSFADELAARIRGDVANQLAEERTALSPEAKPKKTPREKKERTPSDDEDENLFSPPKLTDEDFSPFGSRGGLFSGGKGLFDDEDEESDLFREAPQDREARAPVSEGDADVFGTTSAPSLKEPQKPEQPTPGKSPYLPAPTGLFDDDDDDDFFAASSGKPTKTDKIKSTANIFDDEEDLFKEKAAALSEAAVTQTDENKARAEKKVTLPSSKNLKLLPETKPQKGLFSDEEDTEDLFSSQNVSKSKDAAVLPSKLPKSVSLFDDEDEEDNLFGATAAKKQTSSLPTQSQEKAKPSEPSKKKASALLFSSDEEDQWSITASQTNSAPDNRSKGELRDSGTTHNQETRAVKKTSLFEEDNEDDLFAIAKDSQKKIQRASLLFEDDDADSGSSLFGSPPTSVPPATTKKEPAPEAPPLLFSDEDEKEAQFGVRPMGQKVESANESSGFGRTHVVDKSEKEGSLTVSTQIAGKHPDLFSSSSSLDKGTKSRTKTVLSLFDEEEDKTEDQNSIQAPKKEVGKSPDPDARPKSTGVFQDEELLFSHKLQKDNDPDVDLFSGTKKTKLLEQSAGSLFGDDEDDDLFSSAKSQPLIPEKKRVVKKDHSFSYFKNQKHPESTQGIKEKSMWKPEIPQDSPGLAPFKTKEPSPRICKLQANLAINPAALLPAVAPQILGMNPALPELAFPSSEPGRTHSLESMPTLPGSMEAGVSFDLPAQADTLHSANKSRVKVRGKRRPQTRAARRLAAQESSEAEDMSDPRGSAAQLGEGAISPEGHQPQPRTAGGKDSSEDAMAATTSIWTGGPVPGVDRSSSAKFLGQPLGDDLFDSGDTFSKGTGSQSMGRRKAKAKAVDSPANPPGGSKEKNPMFAAPGQAGSDDDLFQPVKPKPAKKTNPFPLLEDEDDLFPDQKAKKNDSKSNSQQGVISKAQDIFEDDIFATEAIKPSQKTREKERTFEPSLFDDNIDIFADLTVKPKEKSKKKVEAKSIFDDDMDDIFSSGIQVKTTKPKSRPAQAAPEQRSEQKVPNVFDDPLNAFGGQ
ncbi:PREDICTED: WASH complex subunit FAM21A-like isoform X1 [Hipposideros armiger]|uniref:WASH complex subunit FAM21A-like isoform X1 n=2 Tax=Hipposideros armiger TaxID=186990 RepID=A0A8B7SBA7_HIPAR|nr:PREDICTED: WASH complex subunit FAM21A-like isoform X1 [Hipposideros armiger]